MFKGLFTSNEALKDLSAYITKQNSRTSRPTNDTIDHHISPSPGGLIIRRDGDTPLDEYWKGLNPRVELVNKRDKIPKNTDTVLSYVCQLRGIQDKIRITFLQWMDHRADNGRALPIYGLQQRGLDLYLRFQQPSGDLDHIMLEKNCDWTRPRCFEAAFAMGTRNHYMVLAIDDKVVYTNMVDVNGSTLTEGIQMQFGVYADPGVTITNVVQSLEYGPEKDDSTVPEESGWDLIIKGIELIRQNAQNYK
jgi:hypothetical protein